MIVTVAKARCFCSCHQTEIADAQEFRQRGMYASAHVREQNSYMNPPQGVDVRDFVACVFACEGCRPFHSPVLGPLPKQDTWVDPPTQPPPATGCSDDEGPE